MAASRVILPSSPWHVAECVICGCSINQKNIAAYLAFSTQAGSDVVHEIQEFSEDTLTVESKRSYSGIRSHATSPELRLLHTRCYNILRCIWTNSTIPLTTITLIITSALPIAAHRYHPLSHCDAAALVTTFRSPKPRAKSKAYPANVYEDCIPGSLLCAIRRVAYEIQEMFVQYSEPGIALATASCIELSLFNSVIRNDVARRRIAICEVANRLLDPDKYQTHHAERVVTLSEKMKAKFIYLGGEMYLQDITTESSCSEAVDVFIEAGRPEVLALHVDEIGIRNIAFALNKNRRPKWVREDTRIHNIFLDEGTTFERIRIVSDPLKCRMIDVDLPGRDSLQPRPLLPCNLGSWAPLAVRISKNPYAEVQGYIQPSYINLSSLRTVYLSHGPFGGLTDIFTEDGEGRSAIWLGANVKRSVKLFGLCERIVSGECLRGFAFLQVQDQGGQFLPHIDLAGYDVLAEEHHPEIDGIWFVKTDEGMLINVVHEFF